MVKVKLNNNGKFSIKAIKKSYSTIYVKQNPENIL